MARRRANGEGSIRKRSDGSWEGRITIGYDPFGKQVMKSVYGRTQRDVKEKLERLKDDLEGKSSKQTEQADSDSSKDKKEITEKEVDNTGEGICMLTLEQWLDIWRKQYLSDVKPGTVCHYQLPLPYPTGCTDSAPDRSKASVPDRRAYFRALLCNSTVGSG